MPACGHHLAYLAAVLHWWHLPNWILRVKRTYPCRYHVRLDAASTRHTRLLFCTTGILLRRLASDAQLSAVSHVIVDEVRRGKSPAHEDGAQFAAGRVELLQKTLHTIPQTVGSCPQALGSNYCKTVT